MSNNLNIIQRRELQEIEDFYFKGQRPILYLYGPRGSGKTTLVLSFLENIKGSIEDKYIFLKDSNSSKGLKELIKPSIKLLIIDDYSLTYKERSTSITSIKKLSDQNENLKILLISDAKPISLVNENAFPGRVKYLEIKGLNENEQKEFYQRIFKKYNPKIKPSDFDKIIKTINPTIGALVEIGNLLNKQLKPTLDAIAKLQDSFRTVGLIDVHGNPLDAHSEQANDISQRIQIVNNSILNRVHLNPDLLYEISPRGFEELVAELLSAEGFEVNLTQATRDGGKDIFIAHNNLIGDFLYYIECKHYAKTNPVGVNLVRELYGTISHDRATAGMLITTSYFSPDAIEFVQKIKHQMSLKDYIILQDWIEAVFKRKYNT
jgi:predicted AAA+ superfamily ATPase